MAKQSNVDDLIRQALHAEGLDGLDFPGEPSLPDAVTEVFRGRMWWTGVIMMANMMAGLGLAVLCGVKFLGSLEIADMIRWGAGLFGCVLVVIGCKLWYWMRIDRIALTRELKRVELMVAHLAHELQSRK